MKFNELSVYFDSGLDDKAGYAFEPFSEETRIQRILKGKKVEGVIKDSKTDEYLKDNLLYHYTPYVFEDGLFGHRVISYIA